jgi:hypothetical protein
MAAHSALLLALQMVDQMYAKKGTYLMLLSGQKKAESWDLLSEDSWVYK